MGENYIPEVSGDVMVLDQYYDYIVVGSGPGGATVARELASQKRRILLVEYGPRLSATGFMKSAKMFHDRYSEEGISIGRARILGGSSYVAMGNAVTPPATILREWGIDLSEELALARKDLRVRPMPVHRMGLGTRRINDAVASLGWEMKPTPKCVDFARCAACGMCMFGCPRGAKWTALEFVDEAVRNGAQLLLDTEVTQVTHEHGQVTGAVGLRRGHKLELKAHNIVLAAGALETPRILQNSGISGAGKGLTLDVYQATYGYTDDVGMKNEIILATYLERLIEERELFAAPYMYVPFLIALYSEKAPQAHRSWFNIMRTYVKGMRIDTRRLLGMMTKIRDEPTGEVMNDGTIHKALTTGDKAKLDEAHEINKAILIAAGAKPETIFRTQYESGHPACTAAIGRIVDRNQESEISGLFVSDASAFPTPLGMPPILTIVALSKRLAKHLLTS
jgi:choline dehydrogenase-like flavoprotein